VNDAARHTAPPDWAAIERRVAELERVHLCGDADRPLTLAETAARIGSGRSVATLRGWMKRPAARRKFRLDMLLRKDPGGRWYSTARLLSIWQHFFSNQAKQSLYGGANAGRALAPITPTNRRSAKADLLMHKQADKAPAADGAVRKSERSAQ
jgi:hypothetical protein